MILQFKQSFPSKEKRIEVIQIFFLEVWKTQKVKTFYFLIFLDLFLDNRIIRDKILDIGFNLIYPLVDLLNGNLRKKKVDDKL